MILIVAVADCHWSKNWYVPSAKASVAVVNRMMDGFWNPPEARLSLIGPHCYNSKATRIMDVALTVALACPARA